MQTFLALFSKSAGAHLRFEPTALIQRVYAHARQVYNFLKLCVTFRVRGRSKSRFVSLPNFRETCALALSKAGLARNVARPAFLELIATVPKLQAALQYLRRSLRRMLGLTSTSKKPPVVHLGQGEEEVVPGIFPVD
jgi:hypothetical protein